MYSLSVVLLQTINNLCEQFHSVRILGCQDDIPIYMQIRNMTQKCVVSLFLFLKIQVYTIFHVIYLNIC